MTIKAAGRKYWSEWIETAPREEIRALQEKKLKEHVKYIFNHSRFWQDKFRGAKITPDDVNSIDDLARVPLYLRGYHDLSVFKTGQLRTRKTGRGIGTGPYMPESTNRDYRI